jgi:hypothetical protein
MVIRPRQPGRWKHEQHGHWPKTRLRPPVRGMKRCIAGPGQADRSVRLSAPKTAGADRRDLDAGGTTAVLIAHTRGPRATPAGWG